MRLDRLFNVLVLQGALLTSGCEEEQGPEPDEEAGSTTGVASTGSPEEATTEDGETEPAAETTTDAAESTGEAGSTGEPPAGESGSDTEGGSTGDPLECSDPPNAVDPCGCACCWVLDCNNDDACCAGWSECAPS